MNDLNEEIKLLLREGKKIQAIKLTMDHTTLGLKEAKTYVEEIANTAILSQSSSIDDDGLKAEVAPYLAKKNKIMAVKRVRELTGWGLKEAKDFVDRL